MFFFVFVIIYGIILSTEIKYTLLPKLIYRIIFKIEKEIHVPEITLIVSISIQQRITLNFNKDK